MYRSFPLDDLDLKADTTVDILRIVYDPYDLYDLCDVARVAGWDPYSLPVFYQ